MSHNNQNPSNATLAGFSAGYRVADATLEVADKVTGSTKDVAVATGHSVTGFFSGMRYAIAARRGTKVVEAKKPEDPEVKRRAREELWRRAHGAQSEAAPGQRRAIIVLGHEG